MANLLAMDESVTLWRAPAGAGKPEVDGTMEQIGEGFFELRLRVGDRLLLRESFEDAATLLLRSAQLRAERAGPAF